ncbi:MAG TPA: molybdopterin molybdenumtransferase MoeA, partial [Gammaproteobacteria bacterium]|nr:molybdopterin molybdenumtransferase MoeA [Gammaproteobacteria bacterium]
MGACMNKPVVASCGCDEDTAALEFTTARNKILGTVVRVEGEERVPLHVALQRRLAWDVCSPHAVPGYDNSAMDGYALHAVDAVKGTCLPCVGASLAGHPYDRAVGVGECVRIMTGAVMPDGADCVVMQERVTVNGDSIILQRQALPGDHVRYAGEDLQAGT